MNIRFFLILLYLMPVTHVQETCTTNLCKLTCIRNLHVCHSDLQQDFSCASFLHEVEHVIFDVLVHVSCTSYLHVCHQH